MSTLQQTRRAFLRTLAMAGGLGLLGAACAPAAPPAPATQAAPTQAPATPASATQAPATAAAGQPTPAAAGASVSPDVPAGTGGPAPAPKGERLVVGATRSPYQSNRPTRSFDTTFTFTTSDNVVGIDDATGGYSPARGWAWKWQLEPNGKDVRFFLRKGVQFHGGFGEATADDVVYTYNDVVAPGPSDNTVAGLLNVFLDGIEAASPYEVLFHCKVPDASLVYFLSNTDALGIWSKKDFEARGNKAPDYQDTTTPPLAGIGPYQYQSRVRDQNAIWQKVPYKHYRVDADFQQLELRYFADQTTILNSLLTGEIHLAQLSRDDRDLAVQRGMKVFQGPLPGYPIIVSFRGSYLKNPQNPAEGYMYPDSPVMDVRVRKALSKAIDRTALNNLLKGEGLPMYLRYHYPQTDGAAWNPEWQTRFADEYGYDPAAAKQLLADAGYGQDHPLSITLEIQNSGIGTFPEGPDMLEAIGQMWKAVGVNPMLETLDPGAFVAKQRALGFDNHATISAVGFPDPLVSYKAYASAFRVGLRGSFFEHADIEPLLADWARAFEPVAAAAGSRKVGDFDYNLHTHIPLFWQYQQIVANPKFVSAFPFAGNFSYIAHLPNIRAA